MRTLILFLGLMGGSAMLMAQSGWITPTIDGTVTPGEYGSHVNGQNQQVADAGGVTWYIAWDATNFYVAVSGALVNPTNDAVNLYFDTSPEVPVNTNLPFAGSITGQPYDQVTSKLPFAADFLAFAKAGYDSYEINNFGVWSGPTANSFVKATGINTIEISIPWNTVTAGNLRPDRFNWFGYLSYDNGVDANGVFGAVPDPNPQPVGGSAPLTAHPAHYHTVLSTDNGTGSYPFQWESITYHEDDSVATTGGYVLPPGTYYDITVNDNSPDNADNDGALHAYDNGEVSNRLLLANGIFDVHGDIYIGMGSAMLPADNLPTDVEATVNTYGDCEFRNFGRLDCVPEIGAVADITNRRIRFVVQDTMTIMNSNGLDVGNFRFGDLTVPFGSLFRSQPTGMGVTSIEFEYGTVDVNGTMDLTGPTGNHVSFFTRGLVPVTNPNNVYLTSSIGTGVFDLWKLLIGREVSYLRPSPTGAALTIDVHENLEIYSNLICQDGTGEINFNFVGTGRQNIITVMGETGETGVVSDPPVPTALPVEVRFNDITINNNNGLGNNNANADVHFRTYNADPYGTVDFFIDGNLNLISGDLVTRRRDIPADPFAVTDLTVTVTGGIGGLLNCTSDAGGNPSTFIDGPIRRELNSDALRALEFPIGKSDTVAGIGDYRRFVMEIDQATPTMNVYVAEMFLGDISGNYLWPTPPSGETISDISHIRHWTIEDTSSTMVFDFLRWTADYSDFDEDDLVFNAPALRLLKDNGTQWMVTNDTGPGGSDVPANSVESISSLDIVGQPVSLDGDLVLALITDLFAPLHLPQVALDGEAQAAGLQLRWQEPEPAPQRYELLRAHASGFETIAQLPGGQQGVYQVLDEEANPAAPQTYRLRSIYPGGEITYSNLWEYVPTEANGFTVRQDEQTLTLTRPAAETDMRIRLLDLQGRTLGTWQWPRQTLQREITLPALSAGMYLLEGQGPAYRKVIPIRMP